jgi:hypothetical protein
MRQQEQRGDSVRIIAAIAGLCCLATAAHAERFSMQPAIPSPDAPRTLLLDIARAGDRLVAVGEQGHIIWSDDDGASWTHAEVPVSLMLTATIFPTIERGWAVGHEAIVLTSGDSGSTWSVALAGESIAALQVDAARDAIAEAEAALEAAAEEAREDAQWALEDAEIALEDAELAVDEGIAYPALDVWFECVAMSWARTGCCWRRQTAEQPGSCKAGDSTTWTVIIFTASRAAHRVRWSSRVRPAACIAHSTTA